MCWKSRADRKKPQQSTNSTGSWTSQHCAMSTICDGCQKIFRTGVSPLGLGQAHIGAGVTSSNIRLPFNSKQFPHHSTLECLLTSTTGGCHICLILLKFLLSKCSLAELQSSKQEGSFTTYEYHAKIDAESRHPFQFDFIVRRERSYGVWFTALPARGGRFSLSRHVLNASAYNDQA